MTSSHIARWSGFAAMVGGPLLAAKGVVIAFSALLAAKGVAIGFDSLAYFLRVDASFDSLAYFLLASGLVGLHARLEGRGAVAGRIGVLLAYVALAASAVNLACLALGIASSALLAALVGLFAGSVLLGMAHLRAGALRPGWRAVPLIIGVVWLPLMGTSGPSWARGVC